MPKSGISRFFWLTVPNHFVKAPFCVSKSFGHRKLLGLREWVGFTIFRQNCFVWVPNHFVEEPFYVSKGFGYRKMLGIREWVGFTIFRWNCFVAAPIYFVEDFTVFQTFRYRQFLCLRAEYHDFLLKPFWFTVPNHSVEQPFCVSKSFGHRKLLGLREWVGFTIFRQNCFVSVPNHFVEEPFCVSKGFGYQKTLWIREGVGFTIFRQNCFVSQYRIIS